MSNFKIDIGDGKEMKIKQGIGELKAGYRMGGDYSRVSAYGMGADSELGLHTGANSKTVGRHNKPFGK